MLCPSGKMTASRWSSQVEPSEWQEFIEANHGTPYQWWSWRSVLKECGNVPEYLVYRGTGGDIRAACPHFSVKISAYHHKLMGPLNEGMAADAQRAVHRAFPHVRPLPSLFRPDVEPMDAVGTLRHYLRGFRFPSVSSMELITTQKSVVRALASLGMASRWAGGDYLTDLQGTPPSRIWTDSFGKHDRQSVKYFDGLGTTFQVTSTQRESARFLKLHRETTQREGFHLHMMPEFFPSVQRHFGDKILIALSSLSGEAVAAQLLILDRANQTVYIGDIGYLRPRNIHSSVIHLWFKVCEWAEGNGFRWVNFGGGRKFGKQKFGGDLVEKYVFVVHNPSRLYPVMARLFKWSKRAKRLIGRKSQTRQRELEVRSAPA